MYINTMTECPKIKLSFLKNISLVKVQNSCRLGWDLTTFPYLDT